MYTSLRALQRQEVVICTRPAGSYAAFWSAAPEPTDAQMNALLAATELADPTGEAR